MKEILSTTLRELLALYPLPLIATTDKALTFSLPPSPAI
jgi:hypothetical protein